LPKVPKLMTLSKHRKYQLLSRRKMHHAFSGEVVSDIKKRPQGIRIKHRMKSNSIKMYVLKA